MGRKAKGKKPSRSSPRQAKKAKMEKEPEQEPVMSKAPSDYDEQDEDELISSGDEGGSKVPNMTPEEAYQAALKYARENGFVLHNPGADGNCFFRGISYLLYGHENNHVEERKKVRDQLRSNIEGYTNSLIWYDKKGFRNISDYASNIRKLGEWGCCHAALLNGRENNITIYIHTLHGGRGDPYGATEGARQTIHLLHIINHYYALTPRNQQQQPNPVITGESKEKKTKSMVKVDPEKSKSEDSEPDKQQSDDYSSGVDYSDEDYEMDCWSDSDESFFSDKDSYSEEFSDGEESPGDSNNSSDATDDSEAEQEPKVYKVQRQWCGKCKSYVGSLLEHSRSYHRFTKKVCPFACGMHFEKKQDVSKHITEVHRLETGFYPPINTTLRTRQRKVEKIPVNLEVRKEHVFIEKESFTVCWDPNNLRPIYVKEELTKKSLEKIIKDIPHIPYYDEPTIKPMSPYLYQHLNPAVQEAGHLAPKRNHLRSLESLTDTFSTTNIIPMNMYVNRGVWSRLEHHARALTQQWEQVTVVSGPIYREGMMHWQFEDLQIDVPAAYFKVLVMHRSGETDRVQAFSVDNFYDGNNIFHNQANLEEIEILTGISFTTIRNTEMTWDIQNINALQSVTFTTADQKSDRNWKSERRNSNYESDSSECNSDAEDPEDGVHGTGISITKKKESEDPESCFEDKPDPTEQSPNCAKCRRPFKDIIHHARFYHRFTKKQCPFSCRFSPDRKFYLIKHINKHHRFETGLYEPLPITENEAARNLDKITIKPSVRKDHSFFEKTGYTVCWDVTNLRPFYVMETITRSSLRKKIKDPTNEYFDEPDIHPLSPLLYHHLVPGNQEAGHLAPRRNNLSSFKALKDTYNTTNIIPMNKIVNAGTWKAVEDHERAIARKWEHVTVISGPIYSDNKVQSPFEDLKWEVPTAMFKIIVMRRRGEADRIQAFIVRNFYKGNNIFHCRATLQQIEVQTGIVFNAIRELEMTWDVPKPPTFRCPVKDCNKTFLQKSQKEDHFTEHENICRICLRASDSEEKMNEHLKNHQKYKDQKTKPFACTIEGCEWKFTRRAHLRQHIRVTHSDKKQFQCEVCRAVFKWEASKKMHMNLHFPQKDLQCDKCRKQFLCKRHLQRHMVIHTDKRDFSCNKCEKTFQTQDSLRIHLQRHTDQRNYKCDKCEKAFKTQAELTRHKQTHTDEKLFSCNICPKTFTRKRCLLQHMKNVHNDRRDFVCDVCPKAFPTQARLTLHKQTHSDKKNFKCGTCGKEFRLKTDLHRHILRHENARGFSCDQCDMKYNTKQALRLHQKKKHDKPKENSL